MNNNHFIAFNASMVHLIKTIKFIRIVVWFACLSVFIIPILLLPDLFFLLHFELWTELEYNIFFFSYAHAGTFFGYAYCILLWLYKYKYNIIDYECIEIIIIIISIETSPLFSMVCILMWLLQGLCGYGNHSKCWANVTFYTASMFIWRLNIS